MLYLLLKGGFFVLKARDSPLQKRRCQLTTPVFDSKITACDVVAPTCISCSLFFSSSFS
jgi:hypothetical protein